MIYVSGFPTRRSVILGLGLLLASTAALATASLPKGWEFSSTAPESYVAQLDTTVFRSGKASGCLKSIAAVSPHSSAVLMQHILAINYRQRRLRMTGYVRTANVRGWAGLFMRVDPPQGPALAFDNMENRPIQGSTDWKRYSIELNVPQESARISFGALLAGSGEVWLDDVEFETTGTALPGSALLQQMRGNAVPVNLGFEE